MRGVSTRKSCLSAVARWTLPLIRPLGEGERLDGHKAVELQVAGEENDSHATASELALEDVLVAEHTFAIRPSGADCALASSG
jgi:hypothetical protein